jgi:hypothetical protein
LASLIILLPLVLVFLSQFCCQAQKSLFCNWQLNVEQFLPGD